MTSRAVLYARFSSDLQRDASIEDQLRSCRDYAARKGFAVTEKYSDRAVSGASLMRYGIQKLLEDARGGGFDVWSSPKRSTGLVATRPTSPGSSSSCNFTESGSRPSARAWFRNCISA